jgi:hypothetical protein
VGHRCDTRLGSAIAAVTRAHNERAGQAHGRPDRFQARALPRLPPEGDEDFDGDPQPPGPQGWPDRRIPQGRQRCGPLLQLLKPGGKGVAAFLTGWRPPMIAEENRGGLALALATPRRPPIRSPSRRTRRRLSASGGSSALPAHAAPRLVDRHEHSGNWRPCQCAPLRDGPGTAGRGQSHALATRIRAAIRRGMRSPFVPPPERFADPRAPHRRSPIRWPLLRHGADTRG